MPLTSKGKKIMRAMRKQYGKKEGKKVFYASRNKGTISGVEKNEESKMSYLDKVLSISEEEKQQKRGVRSGSMLADMGFTGAKEVDLSKVPRGRKTLKNPDQNIAATHNPRPGAIKSHTEYKRIGIMMAEALGYRVDEFAFVAPLARAAATQIATDKISDMADEKKRKKEEEKRKKAERREAANQTQAQAPGQDPAMDLAHTEYKRIGALMAEALGLRENVVEPTKKQMVRAQRQTKAMPVEGETRQQTREVDTEIEKAQGRRKMSTKTNKELAAERRAKGREEVKAGQERDEEAIKART